MPDTRNPLAGAQSNESMPKPAFGDDAMRSLLYVLSGMGAAIGGEGSVGQALGGMTQQAIQAQSYKNMLAELLKGGGKMSIDGNGVKMQAPLQLAGLEKQANVAAALQEQGSQLPQSRIGYPTDRGMLGESSAAPAAAPKRSSFPFSTSPLVDPALTGLTPQMIASAFGIKQDQEKIENQKAQELLDQIYKAETANLNERKFALDVIKAGMEKKPNSLREYEAAVEEGFEGKYTDFLLLGKEKEKPASIQEYELAREQGFEGTFADFKNIFGTAAISNYEYAKAQGYAGSFEDWQKEMAKAASTTINIGPEERALGTARGRERGYFESAEFRDDAVKNLGVDYEFAETTQEKQRLLFSEMDNKIKQSPRFKDPKFGKRDGVIGWYDNGGEGALIRRWSE